LRTFVVKKQQNQRKNTLNTVTTKDNKTLIAWVLLLILAIVWGTSFLLVKKSLEVFSPIQVGGLRMLIGGIALLPWLMMGYKKISKRLVPVLFVCGMTGFMIPAFFFAIAGSKINSSLSGTLNSTTPIFVLIVGLVFFGANIKRLQVLGLLLGFIGSLILILMKDIKGAFEFGLDNPYVLFILASTVMYGFNVNIAGKYLKDTPATATASAMLAFAGIIASFVLSFTDFSPAIQHPDFKMALGEVIILGAINSGLMAVLFNYLLQISSPIFASSVTYLIPIIATAMGLLDKESISVSHYLGMAVTLIGVYLINKK
jgi:drug/metabolite transporter (DMT)-like permease